MRGGRVNVGFMRVICKLIVYELSYCFHCIVLGIYDDISFLVNLEFFLYDHDQIFITRIYLDILDGFDMIQQQKQDIVQG